MTHITETDVRSALAVLIIPDLQENLINAKVIKQIQIEKNKISLQINIGYPLADQSKLILLIKNHLQNTFPNFQIEINIHTQIITHAVQTNLKPLPAIKNIIAIASGKGGVGKSTTAVNLALALHAEGARVGILDADIYGPNQPQMLGVHLQPDIKGEHGLTPVIKHGIQSISIGYLIDVNTPMIWRGPMVSQALKQLVFETQWHALDYLIIDLPPGTGDIQLTLAQKIPVTGAVIVTTPQEVSIVDARKALEMFKKVNVSVLGIIENMSTYICPHCQHEDAIFGKDGAEQLANATQTELLGRLPLDQKIREHADKGNPTVIADAQSINANIYRQIARRIAAKLSLQARDFSNKFPQIVVE